MKTYTDVEMTEAIKLALARGRARSLDKQQKLAILQRWNDALEDSDKIINQLRDVIGLTSDSSFCIAIWHLQDELTKASSELIGDDLEWLAWYDNENAMGSKGMVEGTETEKRPIRTLNDLVWIMEATK